jgi:hypothetical protein
MIREASGATGDECLRDFFLATTNRVTVLAQGLNSKARDQKEKAAGFTRRLKKPS